jgi:hypothetical protein
MIEIDSSASASASAGASRQRLTPRSIHVRNRCLESLARQQSLPVPSDDDIKGVADDATLVDAWRWWTRRNTPQSVAVIPESLVPGRAATPELWWKSTRVAPMFLVALAFALGVGVGDRWLLPAIKGDSAAEAANGGWMSVGDSAGARLDGILLRLGRTPAPLTVSLSPADAAVLIFGSASQFRPTVVDSVEARVDSARSFLTIRGRVGQGERVRFEVGGEIGVVRSGIGELRLSRLSLGGDSLVAPGELRRLIGSQQAFRAEATRIRFSLPRYVAAIGVRDGRVLLVTSAR